MKWFDAEKFPPEEKEGVAILACHGSFAFPKVWWPPYVLTGQTSYYGFVWLDASNVVTKFRYWMPLPKPPEEETICK